MELCSKPSSPHSQVPALSLTCNNPFLLYPFTSSSPFEQWDFACLVLLVQSNFSRSSSNGNQAASTHVADVPKNGIWQLMLVMRAK